MKLRIPANNPPIAPIEKKAPLKKDESEMPGKNVKDAKMIKIIFAAIIDTTKDIAILNIPFEFILLLD